MIRQFQPEVVAVTADFTLDIGKYPSGTIYTNRGAGGDIRVTLPTLSNIRAHRGFTVRTKNQAGQLIELGMDSGYGDTNANDNLFYDFGVIGDELVAVWDGYQWAISGSKNDQARAD